MIFFGGNRNTISSICSIGDNVSRKELLVACLTIVLSFTGVALELSVISYEMAQFANASVYETSSYGTCVWRANDNDVTEKLKYITDRTITLDDRGCDYPKIKPIGNTLIANVHALLYMQRQYEDGTATDPVTKSATTLALWTVVQALQGQASEINKDDIERALNGVNDLPRTCEEIYPDAAHAASMPHAAHAASMPPSMPPIMMIDDWVLPKITCTSSGNTPAPDGGVGGMGGRRLADSSSSSPPSTPSLITVETEQMLYNMCVEQFSYLRSSSVLFPGQNVENYVIGFVPYPGIPFMPRELPWSFLNTSDVELMPWDARVRILSGARLGWSLWATIPTVMLGCLIFADGICCLLSVLTRDWRYNAMDDSTAKKASNATKEEVQKIQEEKRAKALATFFVTRFDRDIWCIWGLILALGLRLAFKTFAWWNEPFRSTNCEGDVVGWQYDGNVTRGWVFFLAFIFGSFLVGTFSRDVVLYKVSSSSKTLEDRLKAREEFQKEAFGKPDARYFRNKLVVAAIAAASLVCIVASTVVATIYGMAWAVEIADPTATVQTTAAIAVLMVRCVLNVLALAASSGLLMGALLGRYAVTTEPTGAGCWTLLAWFGIVVLCGLPLLTLNIASLVDMASGNGEPEDLQAIGCEVFTEGTDPWNLCESKFADWFNFVVIAITAALFAFTVAWGIFSKRNAVVQGAAQGIKEPRKPTPTGSTPYMSHLTEETQSLLLTLPVVQNVPISQFQRFKRRN
jgi:hypothetical protein